MTKNYSKAGRFLRKRFSNQISITSKTGVGGSTLYNRLKRTFQKLPFRFVSAGEWMREEAAKSGFATIEEFARHNRDHPEDGFDKRCDEMMEEFSRHNYMVGEGRLPHIFMPHSFHVLLVCDLKVRAERRHRDKPSMALQEVLEAIEKRDNDDDYRFKKIYPGALWPEAHYDIVIPTGRYSEERVEELILDGHKEWLRKNEEVIIQRAVMPS